MKACENCGKELVGRQRKFCSTECERFSAASRSADLYKKRQKCKICKLCGSEFLGTDKQVNCKNCGRKRNPVFKKTHKITTVCSVCITVWRVEEMKSTQGYDKSEYRLCESCLSRKHSERMRENNPMFNQETRDKVSETLKTSLYSIPTSKRIKDLWKDVSYREYMSYCSKKNYDAGLYQNFKHIPTELDRENISRRMKENNPMFNQETRDKVSNTRKSRKYEYKRGKEHHLYKGTRTRSNYVRLSLKKWIKDNLIRSDYTCEVCGIRGGALEVHHLSEPLRECISRCLNGRDINDLSDEEFESFRDFVVKEHNNITGLVCCIPCHRDVDNNRH